MTNEELYKHSIEPQLKLMTLSIDTLTKQNAEQHRLLSGDLRIVSDRVFKTNGKKALVVEAAENREDIDELKRMSHEPTMGRARLRANGVKVGGTAGLVLIIERLVAFVCSHWQGWFPPNGGVA